jgi:hypothetical protein
MLLKNLWDKWWRISGHAATFQARVLFTLIYFVFVSPIGIIFRLLQYDPLKVNLVDGATFWEERTPQESPPSLEDLGKQY